jgi:hypothetical protein
MSESCSWKNTAVAVVFNVGSAGFEKWAVRGPDSDQDVLRWRVLRQISGVPYTYCGLWLAEVHCRAPYSRHSGFNTTQCISRFSRGIRH